ncbi:NO signaling/Golgi transport ligand-binding domain-containing protein [Pavlovales sp. CCMP2436]|nr:NO signaling/Golgi transport ligand-binding domain-containing protein [Pavlovales sp. CCMP2436]
MAAPPYQRLGDVAFSKIEKVNSELFTLTYGAIVVQLLKDSEDVEQTSIQLEKMGYNIGMRIIDEFLAKANAGACNDFKETGEVIAKVAFRMFLGVTAECRHVVDASAPLAFHLILVDNPLVDFVELPEHCSTLGYCNLLCGVIRGALEMVGMRVETKLLKDSLWGDEHTEISVSLKEIIHEQYHDDDE